MRFAAQKTKDEQGSTLLIAVAILGLLFFFALVFARLVRFERIASQNYTDSVRARLVARAGVQRAIQEMQAIAQKRHYSHPSEDGWCYALVGSANLQAAGVPLDVHSTLVPSFRLEDPRFQMYGQNLVYSGQLGSTYGDRSLDVYKLKVLDCASMVNLNHPDHIAARRMLKNLLMACFPRFATGTGPANARTAANRVIGARPDGGFKAKSEVHALLVNNTGGSATASDLRDDEWPLLADMITVYGWEDPSTIRPYAINSNAADIGTQLGLPASASEQALRQLLPQPRAPINLNTAMYPVLVALFAETRAESDRLGRPGNTPGYVSISFANAQVIAREIIRYRQTFGPFRTWREFEAFVDGKNPDARLTAAGAASAAGGMALTGTWTQAYQVGLDGVGASAEIPRIDTAGAGNTSELGSTTYGVLTRALTGRYQGHRDLIKAICNPNTMVSKFGMLPTHGGGYATIGSVDIQIPRLIDKSDIVNGTTDACFDSMGMYEITSVGMVLVEDEVPINGMKVLASSSQQSVVQVYDLFRLTTQQDWESNRAYMATGNWVEAVEFQGWDRYDNFGLNKEAYGPSASNPNGYQGWPGVLSGPNYSFDRLGIAQAYAMRDSYVPALWDGYLMLTNLSGYSVQNEDFLVGFARGSFEAFKVRAWWEPVDQDSSGVYVNLDRPTHPENDYLITKRANPGNPAAWVDPVGGEIAELANPMNGGAFRPRQLAGTLDSSSTWTTLGEEGVISETPDSTLYQHASQMFYEGSALWNTGVAIHGRRGYTDPNNGNNLKPHFLAYSGDNLDLLRGSSIRFWVQPLVDPYLRTEEVLFSWVGSNGGATGPNRAAQGNSWFDYTLDGSQQAWETQDSDARAVGMRVVKKVVLSRVVIELQAIPHNTASLSGFLPESWAMAGNNASYVRIDVTPTNGGYNALQPEWIPGSWHWVVINFGPDGADYTASLQVDMNQSWVNQTYGRLRMVGANGSARPIEGEFHGYGGTFSTGPDGRVALTQDTGARARSVVWGTVQFLGDWYHCDAGASATVNSNSEFYADAVQYDSTSGAYVATSNWPTPAPWDDLTIEPNPPTFDHEIILSFARNPQTSINDNGTPGDPSDDFYNPPYVPQFDNPYYDSADPLAAQPTKTKGKPPTKTTADPPGPAPMQTGGGGGGPGPSVTTGAQTWNHTFTGDELGGDLAADGHEWQIDVTFRWKTSNAAAGQDCSDPDGPGPLTGCCSSCKHDSQGTKKSGYGVNWSGSYWCYLIHNNVINPLATLPGPDFWHQGATNPGASYPVTLDRTCDDCHGCERCDVDGPMFFGGEPGISTEAQLNRTDQLSRRGVTAFGGYRFSRGNYGGNANGPATGGAPGGAGATVAGGTIDAGVGSTGTSTNSGDAAPDGINPNTSAYAVFDNIVVRNTKENRTDYRGGGPAPLDFEDRFWETNMAYWTGAGSPGFGAVYHRALNELLGKAGTLGTVTWTSYRSTERLDFEVALWDIPGALTGYNGGSLYDMDNKDLTSVGDAFTATPFGGIYSELPTYGADGTSSGGGDGVIDGYADNPIGGRAHQAGVSTAPAYETTEKGYATEGILLGDAQGNRRYDGLGMVTPSGTTEPHLLVLGIRLAGMPSASDVWRLNGNPFDPRLHPQFGDEQDVLTYNSGTGALDAGPNGTADGVDRLSQALANGSVTANLNGGRLKASTATISTIQSMPPGAGATAIPQPLLGSPIFEDITITLILDKPVTFFAEENGMEGEFNTNTTQSFYTLGGTEASPASGLPSPAGAVLNTATQAVLADGSRMTITGGVRTGGTLSTAITSYDPSTAGLSSYQAQLNLNPYVNIP